MDPNVKSITAAQTEKLDSHSGQGKKVTFNDKHTGNKFIVGRVVDEVSVTSFNYKYVLQRIRSAHVLGRVEVCIQIDGYYTWDAKMKKVVWGQYHSLPSEREKTSLLKLARRKDWPIF